VCGFDLYDKFLVHDHVQALFRELVTFVSHSHTDLARDMMLARDEFPLQSHHVDVLKESKTERIVNIKECPDHRTSEPLFKQFAACHSLKMARQTPKKTINLPRLNSKTPRRSIRVIRKIRFIRMKLPSRWPEMVRLTLARMPASPQSKQAK
jgi:hypothetical protein